MKKVAFIAVLMLGVSNSGWAKPHAQKKRRNRHFSGRVAGSLRETAPPKPSGTLDIENIHTGETLLVNIYNPDGTYNADVLAQLNHLWRCRRTDHEVPIEPELFEVISHVYDRFGKRIQLYSGHRSNSDTFHFKGSASDIHLDGVPLKTLRRFVEELDDGGMGVGIYPKGGFIHVDIRPPPSYRWTDRSSPAGHRRSRKKPVS